MAVTFVGSATASVTADGDQSLPSGLAENDVVIAAVCSDGAFASGGSSGGISDGADAGTWTQLYISGNNLPGVEVYYKVMGATPDTVIDVNNAPSRDTAFVSQAFRGVDTTTPIDNSTSTATNTSGDPDPPSHTTVTANAWRIIMGFLDDDDEASNASAPSGYTNFVAEDSGNSSSTVGCTLMMASKDAGAAGSEDPGAFSSSGSDNWASLHFALRPASGSTYTLTADAGSYALTGTAANLEYGRALDAAAGSFTLSGTDASLEYGYSLTAEAGSFALSGQDAALEFGYALDAEAGSYALTGQDATLTYTPVGGYTLVAEAGSYSVSGTDATLNLGISLTAEAGSFTISGQDASLEFGYLLDAEPGSFAFTGSDGTLVYSAEVVEEETAEVWWPIVLKERKRRQDRERKIAADKIAAARKSAKRKITLHVRRGKPVTESALMKLVEDSVKQVAPKAPADDREDAALDIMIDLAAHIARIADEEDTAALLLS